MSVCYLLLSLHGDEVPFSGEILLEVGKCFLLILFEPVALLVAQRALDQVYRVLHVVGAQGGGAGPAPGHAGCLPWPVVWALRR